MDLLEWEGFWHSLAEREGLLATEAFLRHLDAAASHTQETEPAATVVPPRRVRLGERFEPRPGLTEREGDLCGLLFSLLDLDREGRIDPR